MDTTARYLETSIFTQRRKGTRKIKLQSKVFQELINCLKGTREFFEDIGFKKVTLPVPDQEGSQEFWVLGEVARGAAGEPGATEAAADGRGVSAGPAAPCLLPPRPWSRTSSSLPTFFFFFNFLRKRSLFHRYRVLSLAVKEVKLEQRLRTEVVERLSSLRTKAVLEKEEQREGRKHT